MNFFFPTDKIPPKAVVGLYGGGIYGKRVIEWNQSIGYCDIRYVYDRKEELREVCGIPVSRIEEFNSEIEYLLISMVDPDEEVYEKINKLGLSEKRCIWYASEEKKAKSIIKSYAQNGEDILICTLLKMLGRQKIVYFDIGANDAFQFSNTALLEERFDVKAGILIEPNPILYKRLRITRSKNICLNIGITDEEEQELKFYLLDAPTLSTFCKEEADIFIKNGYKITEEIFVKCRNINKVFYETVPNDHIDVLSVDTEGMDDKIIKSIDFKKQKPTIICVETCDFKGGKGNHGMDIIKYLCGNGYLVFADTFVNTIFVREDHMEQGYANIKTISNMWKT